MSLLFDEYSCMCIYVCACVCIVHAHEGVDTCVYIHVEATGSCKVSFIVLIPWR